ncbi:uncharacterized protein LOC143673739 isoform X1 [Tamandua tetradactyla]|uniref:uncharacterized protein LOC143673739 isoform X1 n=1 Tax=Tamandua tetradactyla TaxID=48850 RepID=UPI0040542F2A
MVAAVEEGNQAGISLLVFHYRPFLSTQWVLDRVSRRYGDSCTLRDRDGGGQECLKKQLMKLLLCTSAVPLTEQTQPLPLLMSVLFQWEGVQQRQTEIECLAGLAQEPRTREGGHQRAMWRERSFLTLRPRPPPASSPASCSPGSMNFLMISVSPRTFPVSNSWWPSPRWHCLGLPWRGRLSSSSLSWSPQGPLRPRHRSKYTCDSASNATY